jgi:hypothetical protein
LAYYIPLNMATVRILDRREVGVEVVALEHESMPVLPVFTSGGQFWEFFGRGPGEGGRINPLATYPFNLAEMAARLEARDEIAAIAFDPMRIFPTGWKSKREPIPVGEYLRFIEEVRPGIERMAAESKAKFGLGPPGSEAFAKAVRWQVPHVKTLVDDARARMSEWNA